MQTIFNIINIPLGYVMKFFAEIVGGDFAAAVLLFTLVINLLLIPLSIKSQKSSVQQTRIKPKLDELKKRYGDDKQRYNTEMQKLYQQENVSMSGGCLPMIVRLLLMMSIYYLVLSPLTYMAGADSKQIDTVYTAITKEESLEAFKKEYPDKYEEIDEKYNISKAKSASTYKELLVVNIIREEPELIEQIVPEKQYKEIKDDIADIISIDKKADLNFNLFGVKGLDLTKTPKFNIDIIHYYETLWLIPIGAFLAQLLTSVISMIIQKKNNPEAPNMAGMMLTMPLISLFIGFGLPGGVGFYWICSSLIGGLIQSGVQIFYGPHKLLASERAKELSKRADFEVKQLQKFSDTKED